MNPLKKQNLMRPMIQKGAKVEETSAAVTNLFKGKIETKANIKPVKK